MGSQVTQGDPMPHLRYPFNSSLESGFRTLALLAAMNPKRCDLQRLVYYDYFLVHSEDVTETSDAPESIHPATPYRSGEVVVRRKLIENGCRLMLSRDLLSVEYAEEGIQYRASEFTEAFLSYLETPYFARLRSVAEYVVAHFATFSDDELANFMTENLGRWGTEFARESVLQEAADA